MVLETDQDEALMALVEAIRKDQRSPEEVAKLAEGKDPNGYAAWRETAVPASPEELAEWEEFRRELHVERDRSIEEEVRRRLEILW